MENLGVLGKNEDAKKLEKLPFSLAKKMHLILYFLSQAWSLTSNGVTSVLTDEKCKIFSLAHVHTHMCMIYFIFLITEEGCIDS